jgi:hypothetical protein
LSKAADIKNRIKKRDARSSLMGSAVSEVNNDISENTNGNIDNNNNNSDNVNVNNIKNENNNTDVEIHEIINKKANSKSVKELVGIYFEPEVKKALDKLQKAEGRGAKSELVNDITKWALKQKGLI